VSEVAQMDMFDDARSVERPQFFNGQELFASDLEGIAGFNRAMRWLHNSSLHQAGIGNGFGVSGRKGDREVQVQAGYALDAHGREIVLLDADVEPVPPVAAERDGQAVFFDLAVSYPSDDELEEAETREGICLPRGVVRLRERPVFCWVRLEREVDGRLIPVSPAQRLDIQAGLKIVLARAQVRNCRLDADLSIAERRNARPPEQPHIACGRQAAQWEAWTITVQEPGSDDQTVAVGLFAPIDTSAAGFRVTPCYSARVEGPRPLLLPPIEDGGVEIIVTQAQPAIIDFPAFPQDVEPNRFTCFIAAADLRGNDLVGDLIGEFVDAARKSWSVTWIGIED
jgi:hypothetical protein